MIKNRNSAEELKELEKNLKSLWSEMIEAFKIPEIVEKAYQLLESVKKWRCADSEEVDR